MLQLSRSVRQVLSRSVKTVRRPLAWRSASQVNDAFSNLQRPLSTSTAQEFTPVAPKGMSMEMAQGIQDANQLILKHGVGKQRLEHLAANKALPITVKWQQMMEIYLGTQLHVIGSLGYPTNDQGIMEYTRHLAKFVGGCPSDVQEKFRAQGRYVWRSMLTRAFELEDVIAAEGESNELSIVDARNTMHKVSTKLIEPEVLNAVADACGRLEQGGNAETEMGMKHQAIQEIVVNQVYLGGSPSLVEELGFGSGDKGYAYMQYRMAYHETDPLCTQYTSSAMVKIWKAAGLDLGQANAAGTMPMSPP